LTYLSLSNNINTRTDTSDRRGVRCPTPTHMITFNFIIFLNYKEVLKCQCRNNLPHVHKLPINSLCINIDNDKWLIKFSFYRYRALNTEIWNKPR